MDSDIGALPWWGGKHPQHAAGPGRWIAGLLASQTPTTYVEPFMGMLGILLQRRPVEREVATDIDPELVNWWLTVQASPEELIERLDQTRLGEGAFKGALEVHTAAVASPAMPSGDVDRAWALTVVLWLCRTGIRTMYNTTGNHTRREVIVARIRRSARRVRHVEIGLRHAGDVIDEHRGDPEALIYCDPPFVGTSDESYALGELGLNQSDAWYNDCDCVAEAHRDDTTALVVTSSQQRLLGRDVHQRPTVHRSGAMGTKKKLRGDYLIANRPLLDPAPTLPGVIPPEVTLPA